MSYYNKITLVGRATRDPDYKTLESGLRVAKFTLAVNRGVKEEVDFLDIVAWEKLAESAQQYVTKGKLLLVDGRVQVRSYEDKDGNKRKATEVIANTIRFLDKKSNGKTSNDFPNDEDAPPWTKPPTDTAPNAAPVDDDDMPF